MSSSRELRSRMAAVAKIGQVTRAMKLVAAARYRKAMAAFTEAGPYMQAMNGMAARLIGAGVKHPLMTPTPGLRPLLLTVTSDRGLCGAFNANIIRQARAFAATAAPGVEVAHAVIGRKAQDAFKQADIKPIRSYANITARQLDSIAIEIANRVSKAFMDNTFDSFWIIFGGYESALLQNVRSMRLLPLEPPQDVPLWPETRPELFEPSAQAVADEFMPCYLRGRIRFALLESDVAEQAARMFVMEQASRNADDLTAQLRLEWNKARQDGITTELADITTGAEAVQ